MKKHPLLTLFAINILIGIAIMATGSPATAQSTCTIYVAQDGTRDYRLIQEAADVVTPGDVVCVGPGTYTKGTSSGLPVVLIRRDGTPEKWITFRGTKGANGEWLTIIDGENFTTHSGFIIMADYIRIEDFDIRNTMHVGIQTNTGASDYTKASHHAYIKGNNIHHIGYTIDGPQQYGRSGIYTGAGTHHYTIDSNVFHHTGRLPGNWGDNHDYVHDHGVYTNGAHDIVFINNILYENKAGWGITVGTNPSTSHVPVYNFTIANNTFVGPNPGRTGNGIIIKEQASNINVFNNIFYEMNAAATLIFKDGTDVTMNNNLVYPNMPLSVGTDTILWPGPDRVATPARAAGNIIGQNPLFADVNNADFFLTLNSPAIDAGTAQDAPSTDFEGTPRPQGQGFDIGADEFGGNVEPPDETPQCSDGKDNDGDGLIDLDDPGCSDANDDNEYNPPSLPSENAIRAYYAPAPVNIDGLLSEAGWQKTESISFSNPAFSDNVVSVSTQWDDDHLYIAYQVTDSHLEAENQKLWQDDGAEIFLDTQNNKSTGMDSNDYHLIMNINDLSDPTGIDVRTTTTANGYTMEIAIPWSLINTIPSENKVMGLLLGNNDRNNGSSSQFDWLGLIETGSYFRPNLWGEIVLARQQDEPPPADCEGDLNEDGRIDVADLQLMINIILGEDSELNCADLNNDDVLSIVDLQVLVNRILGD